MSSRRDRLHIINDILFSIQEKGGKIRPTHLLYKSNLAHNKMKTYLEELMGKGLIKETDYEGNKYYSLTEEGIRFVNEFRKIKEFVDSFGL